mmetsp:Transcript_13575/g.39308  ORF Transcript_13575/g.39308 Transcript_13575/m.39308 type:complete len:272 (+) Transcript_13575:931-1746(+)
MGVGCARYRVREGAAEPAGGAAQRRESSGGGGSSRRRWGQEGGEQGGSAGRTAATGAEGRRVCSAPVGQHVFGAVSWCRRRGRAAHAACARSARPASSALHGTLPDAAPHHVLPRRRRRRVDVRARGACVGAGAAAQVPTRVQRGRRHARGPQPGAGSGRRARGDARGARLQGRRLRRARLAARPRGGAAHLWARPRLCGDVHLPGAGGAHRSGRQGEAARPGRAHPWRTAVRYWLRRAASSARHQDRGGQRRRGGGPNRLRPSTWWDRTA